MALRNEIFFENLAAVQAGSAARASEVSKKQRLREQLEKEIKDSGVEITVIPAGVSFEFAAKPKPDRLSMAQKKTEAKKLRIQAQQELITQYADKYGKDWEGMAKAIGCVDASQIRRAYNGTNEIIKAWKATKQFIEAALREKAA